MKADIWMPLYIGDYLANTSRLSTEQHGAYLLLLMDYWKSGPPPDNDNILAQICKLSIENWLKNKAMLLAFFKIINGQLVHERVEEEILIANKRKITAQENGKNGGGNPNFGKGKANPYYKKDNPEDNPKITQDITQKINSSPSPSPSPLSLPSQTPNTIMSYKYDNKKNSGKGCIFPDNFEVTEIMRDWATDKGVIVSKLPGLTEHFKNHHQAKGSVFKNWQAAWRTWVINSLKFKDNFKITQNTPFPIPIVKKYRARFLDYKPTEQEKKEAKIAREECKKKLNIA